MVRKALFGIALGVMLTTTFLGQGKAGYVAGKFLGVDTEDQTTKKETIRTAVFTVQVGDLIYTARGEKVKPKTGDLAEGLIVNDPVQTLIDGEKIVLLKPDGKELRLKIIKRARAQ
jgi:hypothetical protein